MARADSESETPSTDIISSLWDSYSGRHSDKLPTGAPLKVLILGKTGTGKSALGNTIFDDYDVFESSAEPTSVTQKVRQVTRHIRGRDVTLVDTPGTMDPVNPQIALDEIVDAVCKEEKGYHAFLIVIRYPCRFTKEDMEAVSKFELLMPEMGPKSVLVFTYGDIYRKEQQRKKAPVNFSEFILSCDTNPNAKKILESFTGGWILIDNYDDSPQQVNELIAIVDKVSENGMNIYSSDLFRAARQARKEAERKEAERKEAEKKEAQRRRRAELLEDERKRTAERQRLEAEIERRQKEAVKEVAIKKSGGGCFPHNASVILPTGKVIPISKVKVGDKLLAVGLDDQSKYSEVYMLGHLTPDALMDAVTITTSSGKVLTASTNHYIYKMNPEGKGKLTPTKSMNMEDKGNKILEEVLKNVSPGLMKNLYPGDQIIVYDEFNQLFTADKVIRVENTTAVGMYNPFTLAGNMIVDGVLVSCYEHHVAPGNAHRLLAPVRFLYNTFPQVLEFANEKRCDGIPLWAHSIMKGIDWYRAIVKGRDLEY